jgi:hypothetical protein
MDAHRVSSDRSGRARLQRSPPRPRVAPRDRDRDRERLPGDLAKPVERRGEIVAVRVEPTLERSGRMLEAVRQRAS